MDLKKQNVLFFTRSMQLGGTENVILQLCEILGPHVGKIVVCSDGGVNVEKLTAMGIRHIQIPDISQKDPANVLRLMRTVRRIVREEQITVVHSHHRMAALYARLCSPRGVIRIADVHSAVRDKRLMTRVAFRGTRLIAVGGVVKKCLTDDYGLPDEQIEVIYNAVAPFDGTVVPVPELTAAAEAGQFRIGYIGRFSAEKGANYFIDAIAPVLTEHPEARFYLVGDGEDKAALEAQAAALPAGSVTFLGYRTDVQNVMSQLDLIVLSSLWEGLPLTMLEAFSVGRTAVATAVGGTPDVVRDGVDGLLVPPRDPAAIAAAVCRLIEDPELRKKMEISAAERYRTVFSLDRLAKEYLQYYEQL